MLKTNIKSFKSLTLLVTTGVLCFASLPTPADARATMRPAPEGREPFHGPGHACIAVRFAGAARLGHVGWGVEVSRNRYLFGAVEAKSSDGHAGWYKEGSWADMLAAFQNAALRPGRAGERYDAIRCAPVSGPSVGRAYSVARTMQNRSRHYSVATNNCLHAAHDVMRGYGTKHLPNPHIWRAPNTYYKKFKGREWRLH